MGYGFTVACEISFVSVIVSENYASHIWPGCALARAAISWWHWWGRCIGVAEHFYSEAFIPTQYGSVKREIWVVLINPCCKWSLAWLEIQSSPSLLLDLGKPFACRLMQARNVDPEAQGGLWLSSRARLHGFGAEHRMLKSGVPRSPHLPVWQQHSILLLRVRLIRWGAPGAESAARMAVSVWLLASHLRQFGVRDRGEAGNEKIVNAYMVLPSSSSLLLFISICTSGQAMLQRLLPAGSAPVHRAVALRQPCNARETCEGV